MGDVKDLTNEEAVAKLKELAGDIKICMFCTQLTGGAFSSRPMSLTEVDEKGNLWFISRDDSNKNFEIEKDEKVQLLFSDPSSSHFLNIYGEADIFWDKQSIEKAWTPIAKAWFPEGKEDPAVTAIKVYPLDAHYWDTKNGKMISLIKIAAAAITGKPMDGGVEGQLTL